MGVTSGITHTFQSILETIQGIFAAVLHMFEFVLSSIVGVFKGFANFVEGTLGFAFRELTSHLSLSPSRFFSPPRYQVKVFG